MAKTLTPDEVVASMAAAGWPKEQWATGAAIAMAESSYDPTATNPSSGAAGLWQILPSAHQDLFSKLPYKTAWQDPIVNAEMAYQVWKGRGSKWDAGGWASLGDAQYQNALPAAQAAASKLSQQLEQAGSDTARKKVLADILTPVSPILQAFTKAGKDVLTGIAGGAQQLGGVISATGPAVASTLSFPLEIIGFFKDATKALESAFSFFHNLFSPSGLVRMGAGAIGFVFLIFALVFLYKETSNG